MENEEKQSTGKPVDIFFRKLFFIGQEKKWSTELFEFIQIALFACTILLILALLELRFTPDFKQNFKHLLIEYYEILTIAAILIKLIYNYFTTLKNEVLKLVDNKLSHDVELINDKVDDNTKLIDKYLTRSKIVFEAGINEFDHLHLLALQRILNSLNENVKEIYAIDNSDPLTWWSDTMTGYLAILSKWKSFDTHERRRTVSRIFVYDNNELLSPILAKTVTLHSLIGFKTYIFSRRMFDNIFNKHKKDKNWVIEQKEVFIWDNPIDNKIDFDLTDKQWRNVSCYQSFWSIGSDKNERYRNMNELSAVWDNYYKEKIQSKAIKVWFEFICCEDKPVENGLAKKKKDFWNKIPLEYSELIEELKKNTHCCKNANEVKQIDGYENFGIEIKTGSGTTQSVIERFDFTSEQDIKEMLSEYYIKNTFVKYEIQ